MNALALRRATVSRPTSVGAAAAELERLGDAAEALAGGTWIMRAPLRQEAPREHYVSLAGLSELRKVGVGESTSIGALATHDQLAALAAPAALQAVVEAARLSAFPAVRTVATVGGNVCARGFAEADLLTALLACDATVELAGPDGSATTPLAAHADDVAAGRARGLLVRLHVEAPVTRRSVFERLSIRGGGEYAVASVAVSADVVDGAIARARVAFGSIEDRPRLSAAVARLLEAGELDEGAREAADELDARDAPDASAAYRRAVVPALLRRAAERLVAGAEAH